jgi:hypothetical protein
MMPLISCQSVFFFSAQFQSSIVPLCANLPATWESSDPWTKQSFADALKARNPGSNPQKAETFTVLLLAAQYVSLRVHVCCSLCCFEELYDSFPRNAPLHWNKAATQNAAQ